jgi:hypothetical protein
MLEPIPASFQRLVMGGQLLLALGLSVILLTVLIGLRRPKGIGEPGVLFGGTLVTMGVVALYAGRAAGGQASYTVGVVPLAVLVIVVVLLMALLVARMGLQLNKDEERVQLTMPMPMTPGVTALYALLGAAYVIPVGAFALRTVQSENTRAVVLQNEIRPSLRAEITRQVGSPPSDQKKTGILVRLAEGYEARSVTLKCRMRVLSVDVVERVATFDPVPVGPCLVYLPNTERPFDLARPGDELSCKATGGETDCEGGWVQKHMGTIIVTSEKPGTVRIGGSPPLALPVEGYEVRPEAQRVDVRLDDGLSGEWTVLVGAGEQVTVELSVNPGRKVPRKAPKKMEVKRRHH